MIESVLKNSPSKHMHENTQQRSNRLITEQQSNPAMNFLTMGKLLGFFLWQKNEWQVMVFSERRKQRCWVTTWMIDRNIQNHRCFCFMLSIILSNSLMWYCRCVWKQFPGSLGAENKVNLLENFGHCKIYRLRTFNLKNDKILYILIYQSVFKCLKVLHPPSYDTHNEVPRLFLMKMPLLDAKACK